jgi:hypothetical protein
MVYEEFELQIGPPSGEGHLIRVLRSPAGEGEGTLRLRGARNFSPEEEEGGLPSSPAELGSALFRALFSEQIGLLFFQSLSQTHAEGRGLRIRLRINPRDPSLTGLQRLPWELLYRADTEDFLALSRLTPVVRGLDVPRPSKPQRIESPLRILAVLSQSPQELKLDLIAELDHLRASLRKRSGLELQVLENPDVRTLRAVLHKTPFHVLHYMGHGTFTPHTGEGALLFCGDHGTREPISGRHLATTIKDIGSLRLVVLNACETALASTEPGHNPFSGVATALVLGGVPAVVAMQAAIHDSHAIAFSAAFYDRLAHGMPVDEAMTEGRQAIHSLRPSGAEWAMPVLFLRTESGDLFKGLEVKAATRIATRDEKPRRPGVRTATSLLLALLLAVLVGIEFRRRTELAPASGTAPVQPPEEPLRLLPKSSTRAKSPAPGPAHSRETPPHPQTKLQTVKAGNGGGVRFEIASAAGFPTSSFTKALESAARKLSSLDSGNLAGSTVLLKADSPRLSGYMDSGLSLQSCATAVAPTILSHGSSSELATIRAVRSAVDSQVACDASAEFLAHSVVQQLYEHFQREPL